MTNLSPDPVQTRIVQHPAFGAPFLDDESYLVARRGTIVTDADAPGSLASADARRHAAAMSFPPDRVAGQHPSSRSRLRVHRCSRALTDFADAEVHVLQPDAADSRVRLRWDGERSAARLVLDRGERRTGWPWFRRLYAVAVEPANVLPGEGGSAGATRAADRHRDRRRRVAHLHDLTHQTRRWRATEPQPHTPTATI